MLPRKRASLDAFRSICCKTCVSNKKTNNLSEDWFRTDINARKELDDVTRPIWEYIAI